MRVSSCLVVAGMLSLSGCAVMDKPVSMADLQQPAQHFVVDQSPADSYPGFLAAEGNDFSCRYGIHHESKTEFVPPKAQMFEALLAQALPAISTHKVVLQRFDVYFNYRLMILNALASAQVGGVVGSSMESSAAHQNMGVFTFDKLLVDSDPEVDRYPGANQVGCDNQHEGEYYPSEISGGHDVVVTWLKFSVDDHPYYFKTFYQFQPVDKAHQLAGIAEAIRMSVQAVAGKIQL